MRNLGASPEHTAARPAADGKRDYNLAVGELTHRVIQQLAAHDRTSGQDLVDEPWLIAGRLVKASDLGGRARAARLVIAGSAAVYLRYFLPPTAWRLVGVEVDCPGTRVDLTWETRDSLVVYDEIKLCGSLSRPTDDGPTRRQAGRYAAQGLKEHGGLFGGVRLLLLGAPRQSMLIGPGDRLRRLVDTEFWFEAHDAAPVRP